jgi:hypothetical protein
MIRLLLLSVVIPLTFLLQCQNNQQFSSTDSGNSAVTTKIKTPNKISAIKGAVIYVKEHDINAGSVKQNSELTHDFFFFNRGDKPLLLSKVRTNCNCTVASYPQTPLMPGDSAQIVLNLSTEQIGEFHKLAAIYSNAINDYDSTINSSRVLVKVRWKVIP